MNSYIKNAPADFPLVDTNQMIEVDRLMIEEYHIDLVQMMENAGRCLAILTKERFFGGDIEGKRVVVLAGTGGNGGGALVAARRLHNWGAHVSVFTTEDPEKLAPVPLRQYNILQRMDITLQRAAALEEVSTVDVILDGIIGYSLHGDPREDAATFIHWANAQNVPTVALDTPSGLDLTSGILHTPTVRAAATLTLAMPKQGLFSEEAKEVVNELYLGDISVPTELYHEDSLKVKATNLFRYADVVKIY